MKKIIVMLVAGLVTSAVFAQVQEVTETYTNSNGDVFTDVVVGYVGTGVAVSVPSAGTTVVGTTAPSATPTQLGQIAVDATVDVAYIAVGTTSSDWNAIPQLVLNTTADVAATTITPVSAGAILYAANNVVVGASTGTLAIAVGTTTNDWKLLD